MTKFKGNFEIKECPKLSYFSSPILLQELSQEKSSQILMHENHLENPNLAIFVISALPFQEIYKILLSLVSF